jgi:hypothetical protein
MRQSAKREKLVFLKLRVSSKLDEILASRPEQALYCGILSNWCEMAVDRLLIG